MAVTIKYLSDTDFLLSVLRDGEWHELNSIIATSQAARGHGLTVHSRASDLRAKGHTIETRQQRTGMGRVLSFYRMGALKDASGAGATPSPATEASLSAPVLAAVPQGSTPDAGTGALFLLDLSGRGAYGDDAA